MTAPKRKRLPRAERDAYIRKLEAKVLRARSRVEHDEKLVAEAGPWTLDAVGAMIPTRRKKLASFAELAEIMLARHALVNIANRIHRARGKEGK